MLFQNLCFSDFPLILKQGSVPFTYVKLIVSRFKLKTVFVFHFISEQSTAADPKTAKVKRLRVKYRKPVKAENHSEADDVVLIQVTTAGSSLKEIEKQANNLLDNDFLKRTIDFKSLTDEHRLTDEEVCSNDISVTLRPH